MTLNELAGLAAAFAAILGMISGFVVWALNQIISRKFAEIKSMIEAQLRALETNSNEKFMATSSCEKIRHEQALNLGAIIRDELNKHADKLKQEAFS